MRIKQKIRDASLKSRLWQKVREARTAEEVGRAVTLEDAWLP